MLFYCETPCDFHNLFEPRHEKTGFSICERKDADQLRGNREADLCFRYIGSTIPLISKPEVSSLQPSSVFVQPGLCRTRGDQNVSFLMTRLILTSRQSVSYVGSCIVPWVNPYLSVCLFKEKNPRCDPAKRGVPSGAILFA